MGVKYCYDCDMEDYVLFILILIITSPITYWVLRLMFRWVDFMSSLKVKSFFYTKFGLKFGTTERIQDFGTFVYSFLMGFVITAITFYPIIYL